MKTMSLLFLGMLIHIIMLDMSNLTNEIRFTKCVVKMHYGVYPDLDPVVGGHYCLVNTKPNIFNYVANFRFQFEQIYIDKIGQKLLLDAYEANKDKK